MEIKLGYKILFDKIFHSSFVKELQSEEQEENFEEFKELYR